MCCSATRAELRPNPMLDAVLAVVYCLKNDDELAAAGEDYCYTRGIFYWCEENRKGEAAAAEARFAAMPRIGISESTNDAHVRVERYADEVLCVYI